MLSEYSDEELKVELKRRESAKETRPQPVSNPDWDKIIKFVESDMDDVVKGEYHEDNDNAHYLWEEVMQVVYGKDVFEWWNKNAY